VNLIKGMTLTPAYNKDYKSKKEVLAALNGGADFVANHFTGHSIICSVRDLADGEHSVRYKKLASVMIAKVKNGVAS
jgi:hypothetical protein